MTLLLAFALVSVALLVALLAPAPTVRIVHARDRER